MSEGKTASEELHDQIDQLEAPDDLHRRLIYYEQGLKNGGKGDAALLSRGVSAVLASQLHMRDTQMSIHETLKTLATRDEVRSMISSHASMCASARGDPNSADSLEIGKGWLRARGDAAVRMAVVAVALLAFVLYVAVPYGEQLIRAWRSSAPVEAPAAK